jgi:phage-related protein
MNVFTVQTEGGKDLIMEFISELPKDEKSKAIDILEKLEEDGMEALEILNTRQLRKKLWEIKFYRHNRFMYVVVDDDNCYILHACKKQKNKAEQTDLNKAVERARLLGKEIEKDLV